jgi:hypothetical protein
MARTSPVAGSIIATSPLSALFRSIPFRSSSSEIDRVTIHGVNPGIIDGLALTVQAVPLEYQPAILSPEK